MKVVLFCGGKSLRLRDYSSEIPKPMVEIGKWPILLHVMNYYAHFGHKEFILCLGHKGDVIREAFHKQFSLAINGRYRTNGSEDVESQLPDMSDWNITFVDTGEESNVGERLVAVQPFLRGDEIFLANYADGLTDCHLPSMLAEFEATDAVGACMAVRPPQTFHVIDSAEDGTVIDVRAAGDSGFRINGGFFAFRKEIFDYIEHGEDLMEEPFARLLKVRKLLAHNYDGFWMCMDTFKEKMVLDEIHASGSAPWELWESDSNAISVESSKGELTI